LYQELKVAGVNRREMGYVSWRWNGGMGHFMCGVHSSPDVVLGWSSPTTLQSRQRAAGSAAFTLCCICVSCL